MNEYRVRPYKIVKPIPSNAFIDTGEETIEIPWTPTEYACFLAECYELEDEILKEIYEDLEADYWINENKNNF